MIPLRDMVIFPGVTAPVVAGREVTLNAIQAALDAGGEQRVFVVAQAENSEEVTPENLHTIGTIARIERAQQKKNHVQLVIEGVCRGIAIRFRETDAGYYAATLREVEELTPLDPDDPGGPPAYFVLVTFTADGVSTIRDFRYARYVMADAAWERL